MIVNPAGDKWLGDTETVMGSIPLLRDPHVDDHIAVSTDDGSDERKRHKRTVIQLMLVSCWG